MRVQEEFSKAAAQYGQANIIQTKVARKLLEDTNTKLRRILDIGCGSGTLYSLIDWEVDLFLGIDFSQQMLELHPVGQNIQTMLADFNESSFWDKLSGYKFDRIYSASALQWANDLEAFIRRLDTLETPYSLAIFTSGTFKTLHECAGLQPLLRSAEEIMQLLNNLDTVVSERVSYTLHFASTREMFRYIKRSGVSAGRRVLSVSQMRSLMKRYPLEYLEFEVLFITKN